LSLLAPYDVASIIREALRCGAQHTRAKRRRLRVEWRERSKEVRCHAEEGVCASAV